MEEVGSLYKNERDEKGIRGESTCWLRLRGQIVRITGKNQKLIQTDLLLCNAKVRYEVVRNSV